MKTRLFLSIAVVLSLAAAAQAQTLTFSAGYLNPGQLNVENVRAGLDLRGTGIYGLGFEAGFLKIFGWENTIEFSPKFVQGSLGIDESGVKAFFYRSDIVVNAPIGRFVPYASAGPGLLKPYGTGIFPFDTKFAVNYGGGVKLQRLAGPFGLRLDVRGYSIPNVVSKTVNLFEISGGLTIHLGRDH